MTDVAADEQPFEPDLARFNELDEPIRMPWGDYEGVPIEDLEHHYLKELVSWHRKRLDEEVFQEIERVLRQRP